jgi:methylated-DNA-[protein]-cysteine S-methyltransferase
MYRSYYNSPVGIVRISVTDSYVAEVHFCKEDEPVEHSTADQFHPLLQQCTEQLIEYFQGARKKFDLPVFQEGTSFQQSVWGELTSIPFGKTISYMDLAKKLGDPKVIRAAASTNGKNRIAIIVPCHRVIGSNRELVGYAGGLRRKRWLLEHEQKIAHGVLTLF